MTCNSPNDNDFDLDASVSSVNSDSEKVDNTLIKRILSEMKSEFNRGSSSKSEDGNENDNQTEDVLEDDLNYVRLPKEESKVKQNISDNEDSDITPKQDTSSIFPSVPVIVNKTDFDSEGEGEEYKPRLILTLRTNEEDREISCKLSRRSNVVPMSYTESDSSVVDKIDNDNKGSIWESRCRRSLRSSSRLTDKESDHSNLKRSSRRFSKEQCRESVLQNAIARKEKSFSSFNQPEERSARRGARSPRQSSGDSKSSRSMSRSKSPKAFTVDRNLRLDTSSSSINVSGLDINSGMKQASLPDTNVLVTIKTETDLNMTFKPENYELSEDSNDTTNVNSASTNSQTSEPSDLKPMKTNKMYTKTGKRRAKYFKGLKYSLTTGGSVRKKALNVAKKGRKKIQGVGQNIRCTKMVYKSENNIAMNCEESNLTTENERQNCERDGLDSMKEREHFLEDDESSVSSSSQPANDKEKLRTSSPVLGNVCLSTVGKRKYQPDIAETDVDKRCCRVDVPSPCQGDVEIEPDKPEATAITLGVGSAGLCLCNSRLAMYAKTTNSQTELYCQAVDSLDGRLIGCCNTVGKDDARLLRPSTRVPFLVLCDVHHDRLQRHNCCPGCGIFCTQGQFIQCCAYHQYHRDCQLTEEGKEACPHCGSEENYEVTISLGAHKYPVFFPLQKPPKKM